MKKYSVLNKILLQLNPNKLRALFLVPYTIYLTKVATGSFYPIRFIYKGPFIPVKIRRANTGKIIIEDKVILESWGNGIDLISIMVGENAKLRIGGEFVLGQGTKLFASAGATLNINGRLNLTASGITCHSTIMAEKSVEIGYDCIISWGCFLSDSNWHDLSGSERTRQVNIGDRVWIAHDVSVMPDAKIGDGCVVGAKSLVTGKEYLPSSLLAGIPARVIRKNVTWSR
jgi:acetyltransferase-like isoleucine patch superfamily enzyme